MNIFHKFKLLTSQIETRVKELQLSYNQGQGYKTFSMLNSAEHEILNARKYKNIIQHFSGLDKPSKFNKLGPSFTNQSLWSFHTSRSRVAFLVHLTLKAPITTAADDIHQYFFNFFLRKLRPVPPGG